ncbi:MAG TPA: YihY/virulence factor BrkB family protein [Bryobacteraceae bacterium]|jgi:membrane protein
MLLDSHSIYVTEPGLWARLWWLLRRSFLNALDDNCFGIAKAAAYSSLMAFFPVITTLAAVLVRAHAEQVAHQITELMFDVVPPGTEQIVETLFKSRGSQPPWLLVTAIVLALWAASGVTTTLMEGFRAAYRLPQDRGPVASRTVAMALVLCVSLPVIGSCVLILFGQQVSAMMLYWVGLLPEGEELRGGVRVLSNSIGFILALGGMVLGTMLLYMIGPNTKVRLREVWPGALLAAALWMAATVAFAWYVRNIANYNVLYGSVAAAIALLGWMYLLNVITLIGCEFNVAVRQLRAISSSPAVISNTKSTGTR